MKALLRRLFQVVPVSDSFLLKKYLHCDPANFALAKLTVKEGEQTIGVYAPRNHRDDGELNYFYLTGRFADTGDTFVLTKENEAHLVWDRQPLKFTATELLPYVLSLQGGVPRGMRWPLWIDSKKRTWYFSTRSNVQRAEEGRGFSFVLHRDAHEGDETEGRYHVFYTNLEHFTSGHWLIGRPFQTPVYDPDYYEWVSEDDLINDARRQFNKRYTTERKLDMIMSAIARLSGDRLVEHPELIEMEAYRKELLDKVAVLKKEAIDNPRVHFNPSKRTDDYWAMPDYQLHALLNTPTPQKACDDYASLTDRGDSCTSTDSSTDNPQE